MSNVSGFIENLLEVTKRINPTELEHPTEFELAHFCGDFASGSSVPSLATNMGLVGTKAYGAAMLHAGIVIGIRYAHDYGAPQFVLDLFEELSMFKED